jgi:hypothetical protein
MFPQKRFVRAQIFFQNRLFCRVHCKTFLPNRSTVNVSMTEAHALNVQQPAATLDWRFIALDNARTFCHLEDSATMLRSMCTAALEAL